MTDQTAAADLNVSNLSVVEATARLDGLRANSEWAGKFLGGNQAARREHDHLAQIIANGGPADTIDAIMAGTPPAQAVTGDGLPNYREMAAAAAEFRAVGISDAAIRQVLTEQKISRAEQDMARAWLADHKSNAEWRGKLLAGDNEARRQFTLASIILSSEVAE